ncbi:GTP-binding protein Rit1 [Acrasis kona]|uniref:GTP-binding protein Rit1 n=1 Tax=Acrasis kona TaxID=1008807 RepID=A0AAW2YPX3_9EUKA
MMGCYGFLIVCDLTDPASMDNLIEFVELIRRVRNIDDETPFPAVLCGNKVDLTTKRKISLDELRNFSKKYINGCPVFETSATSSLNVKDSFIQLVRECLKQRERAAKPKEKKPRKSSFLSSSGSAEAKSDLDAFVG